MRGLFLLLLVIGVTHGSNAALPPVPVPAENPLTEEKRVLGKILFWDEQLSSDDSTACGTCHRPAAGGGDPRTGVHPGELAGSVDDVAGSPGIRRLGADGEPLAHPVFGDGPQATRRMAPSIFGALWAPAVFWDGRADGRVVDPETGRVLIEAGGALENQVLETLLNDAEMARADRTWADLTTKLDLVAPLALADRLPPDVADALDRHPTYPALFEAAFGEPHISVAGIAFAVASYERTLVADETPWDRYIAGDESALGPLERFGWSAFRFLKCASCHEPPLFTDNRFANIGVRRSDYDPGRAAVTGDPEDLGEMKVPSLRNAALRPRFMHTGEFGSLGAAIAFYRVAAQLPDVDGLPGGGAYAFSMSVQMAADIESFLTTALTDPRVAAEVFPFDRPRLRSER